MIKHLNSGFTYHLFKNIFGSFRINCRIFFINRHTQICQPFRHFTSYAKNNLFTPFLFIYGMS